MRIIKTTFFLILSLNVFSQELNDKEKAKFSAAENELRVFTESFDNDSISFEERAENIHSFIPRFIAILKEENSFHYSFDSLLTVSIVESPDKVFRIFTWQLKEPLGTHKYYGAIQMNTAELNLIPLFDYSDTMDFHTQKTLTAENWHGGLYYNCILTEYGGEKTYTLLGYDEADFLSSRKFMETIYFTHDGQPKFGHPNIIFYDSLGNHIKTESRFFIEYDNKAKIKFNYDEEQEKIIYDCVSPTDETKKDAYFTYLPDGFYEGFMWTKGYWYWLEKVFYCPNIYKTPPPAPKPLFGDINPNPISEK